MTQFEDSLLLARLENYLHSWGLREFHDEASYFSWQRTCLSRDQLLTLEALVEQRTKESSREGVGPADIDFYNFVSQAGVLPVLYSQRYDYYRQLGVALCGMFSPAKRVLDFGCGVGLLTTFFAKEFPDIDFVGVDRSPQSIVMAEEEAKKRHVKNVSYHIRDVPRDSLSGSYDVILSAQAVFQSEMNPGLPSMGWQTFQRRHDMLEQVMREERLGLMPRLDNLMSVLEPNGRMIFFEKTGHLGRRILFQRALGWRGFQPLQKPMPLAYRSIDEYVIDGPLYEISQSLEGNSGLWNEDPIGTPGDSLYGCGGRVANDMGLVLFAHSPLDRENGKSPQWGDWKISLGTWRQALAYLFFKSRSGVSALLTGGTTELPLLKEKFELFRQCPEDQADQLIDLIWGNFLGESADDDRPGYENHSCSAQEIYAALPLKVIEKELNSEGEKGKAMHLEFGRSDSLWYFYWANTFDQRQLILVGKNGEQMLRAYFEDSIREIPSSFS